MTWAYTPLDFISRTETPLGLFWAWSTQILYKLRIPLLSRQIKVSPYDRIPSDKWLPTNMRYEVISEIFIAAFASIFVAAWNFHFPTQIERTLWRAASIYNLIFCTFGAGYMFLWLHYFFPWYVEKRDKTLSRQLTPQSTKQTQSIATKLNSAMDVFRNNSPNKDPLLDAPMRFIVSIAFLSALYCLCRLYLLVEDCIGLRSLPPSSYKTVDWSKYIPHL